MSLRKIKKVNKEKEVMACNCVTNQQLEELYKRFGHKIKPTGKETLGFRIRNFFVNIGVYASMLIITPLLFLYVACVGLFGDRKISLRKFFKLKEISFEQYVQQQQ